MSQSPTSIPTKKNITATDINCAIIMDKFFRSLTSLIFAIGFGNKFLYYLHFTCSYSRNFCYHGIGCNERWTKLRCCCATPKLSKPKAACRFYVAHSTNAESESQNFARSEKIIPQKSNRNCIEFCISYLFSLSHLCNGMIFSSLSLRNCVRDDPHLHS